MKTAREVRYSVALDATTDALMKSSFRSGRRAALAAAGIAVRNHPGNGKRSQRGFLVKRARVLGVLR